MKHAAFALAAVVTLAACEAGTTAPEAADEAPGAEAPLPSAPLSASLRGGPERVEICHVESDGTRRTMTVPRPAVDAHLRHGDTEGPCEEEYVDPDGCPASLLERTPDVVVSDLRAALAAEDWTAVACNYHPDAFVIDDQGVLLGRTEIVSSAQSLNDLFSGAPYTVTDEDLFRDVVRTLFSMDGGWVIIPNGVDTYVTENGMITRQTRHALIEFTGPPPDAQ